jgi:hypothetical protein
MSNSHVGQGTEGFPSLLRLHKGRIVEKYNGERSPEKLAEFVNKAVEPLPNKRKGRTTGKSKARPKRPKGRGKTKKLKRKN